MVAVYNPPKHHEIVLCPEDYEYGRTVGFMRQREWDASDRPRNSHGCDDLTSKTVVFGALAELAAARALGARWTAPLMPVKGELDIAGVCEVRSGSKHNHRMLLRPGTTKPDVPYLHLTSEDGGRSWQIHGWIMGRDGMIDKYLEAPGASADRPKAWFVPSRCLCSFGSFPR